MNVTTRQQLWKCPFCERENFSTSGMKAHRCRAKGRRQLTHDELLDVFSPRSSQPSRPSRDTDPV